MLRAISYAAAAKLRGPSRVVELEGVTHFDAYRGVREGVNEAATWFREHLATGAR